MNFNLFLSIFGLIFVSELPDKTAFATLFLATRHNPLAVFIGAATAFVIQSLVAVAFGSVVSLLPRSATRIAAGLLLLVFAILMWRRKDASAPAASAQDDRPIHSPRFSKTVLSSFMVIFIAEWGDLTQLATATLAARYQAPIIVFLASTLALWAVTAIGVIVGCQAKHFIQPKLMQRMAAIVFTVAGIALLIG